MSLGTHLSGEVYCDSCRCKLVASNLLCQGAGDWKYWLQLTPKVAWDGEFKHIKHTQQDIHTLQYSRTYVECAVFTYISVHHICGVCSMYIYQSSLHKRSVQFEYTVKGTGALNRHCIGTAICSVQVEFALYRYNNLQCICIQRWKNVQACKQWVCKFVPRLGKICAKF